MSDTIFALSSGAPPAAIAIMRISGAKAVSAATALAGTLPEPRLAGLRSLRDPASGDVLDRALLLVFPGPGTASGEDLVELHLHGGRAVVQAVDQVLSSMPGLRRAEAGEFTRRALENGRIDLTEAEGLADLLAAETEAQRRAAVTNAEGGLRRQVERWSSRAVSLAAAIEAAIDHEDEDDVDEDAILEPVRSGARLLAEDITTVLAQPRSERLRDGIRVVLAGPPNSGKSSLFNALVDRDAAIVSAIAGTTRDLIEAPVSRGGLPWVFIDTAGLAEATEDVIEKIGIDRARASMAGADLTLWLGDDAPPEPAMIAVRSRIDEPDRGSVGGRINVSSTTGQGVDQLWEQLVARASQLIPVAGAPTLNRRQAECARAASHSLYLAASEHDPLLIAEELRATLSAFDRLTGNAGVENVLKDLFGRFCIGK